MAKRKRDTPARRAKRRHDPAVAVPPPAVKGDRTLSLRNVRLNIAGRQYPIDDNIEGDTPWSMGMDQSGTISLPVRDPSGSLTAALQNEDMLQRNGVWTTINNVTYMVSAVDCDDTGLLTLTLEDEVSWRLKQFSSYKAASRATITRFGFIQSFADEASRAPLERMRTFIPEIDDKQPILPSKGGS